MVIINVVKDPADSKTIILRHFISLEGFEASRDTANHIITDNKTTIVIMSLDIYSDLPP